MNLNKEQLAVLEHSEGNVIVQMHDLYDSKRVITLQIQILFL